MHTIEQTAVSRVVLEQMSHFLRDFISQPAFAILNCNGTYAIVSQQFHRFHSYKDIGASFNLDGGILKVKSFIGRVDGNPRKVNIDKLQLKSMIRISLSLPSKVCAIFSHKRVISPDILGI